MVRRRLELAGRYRLEEPLGRGGMGEVWRGFDLRLRRPVAVKILPLTVAAEPVDVARFRREAEVAATLNHPGITTVFDIGEHRDEDDRWLFLVMELLIGRDLRFLLAKNPAGLPVERVRELAEQITGALAVAHHHGVVHRDVKPANLFLLEGGRIKICDFGIARLADATKITSTGATAGTPMYMAPEQIDGGEVDQRTDLYAFGCVLYELLTGATWIPAGDSVAAILYQQINHRPKPPRSVRPDIPDQLDSLVLDLLAKHPADRPPSATAVAERLRRPAAGLDHPPRPGGLRTIAILRHTSWVSSVAFSPDGTSLATGGANGAARLCDVITGRTTVNLSGHTKGVSSVAFSPDGATLATGSFDETVRTWDVASGRTTATLAGHTRLVTSVAFSPDGETLATGSYDDTVRLWDVATGRTTAIFSGHGRVVIPVAFSPDGTTLATGSDDDTIWLWDVATGRTTTTLTGHGRVVIAITFGPDGKTLATGSCDGTARLWDPVTGCTKATLRGHGGKVTSVAFSPDGTTVATGSADETVRLWDVATGRTAATLSGHDGTVTSVAFSPDGATLATGSSDETARRWKIE